MTLDPYHRWLGIAPKDQPPNHYRLLGIDLFESDREVIADAAMQRTAHVRTYQLGRHQPLSQRILNELAAAKACLLDSEQKAQYDAQLRQSLAGNGPGAETAVLNRAEEHAMPRGSGLRRWFGWVASGLSALMRRFPRRHRALKHGEASGSLMPADRHRKAGLGAELSPPPLPATGLVPPLPEGPARSHEPAGDFPAHHHTDAQSPQGHQDQEDPFEKLRCTAIQSLHDRRMEESPRQLLPGTRESLATDPHATHEQDDGTQLCQSDTPFPSSILWILDDGQRTGQAIRMRSFPFQVGRTRGDLRIPHDPAIDDPHVELSWCDDEPLPQFVIRDVGSRTGLFVRAAKATVKPGQEIRIGSGCYRLTEPFVLEELSPEADRRLALAQEDVWLGRTSECRPLHLAGDSMADCRHAKMTPGEGVWHIEDHNSLNGTWIRVPQIVVRSRAEFLIGEQMMVVTILRFSPTSNTANRKDRKQASVPGIPSQPPTAGKPRGSGGL